MKSNQELERLTAAVRRAEAELDVTTLSALKPAAKRLMRAKEALKAAEDGETG